MTEIPIYQLKRFGIPRWCTATSILIVATVSALTYGSRLVWAAVAILSVLSCVGLRASLTVTSASVVVRNALRTITVPVGSVVTLEVASDGWWMPFFKAIYLTADQADGRYRRVRLDCTMCGWILSSFDPDAVMQHLQDALSRCER